MDHEWRFPCTFLENYDGDTVTLSLDLGFLIRYEVDARLHGVDTPELRGGNAILKAAGKYARDEVRHLLEGADNLVFVCEEWSGKYGRTLGDIEVAGTSLRSYLISGRMGVAYDGGSRKALFQEHMKNAEWLQSGGMLGAYLA